MLSDFDLAKQSTHRGGMPATVAQIEPNGVSVISTSSFPPRCCIFFLSLLSMVGFLLLTPERALDTIMAVAPN